MRAGWKGLLVWAAAFFVAATAVLASIPILFGSPQPIVRITWRDVSPADRVELERQFHLTDPIPLADGDWGYAPLDTSPHTLRAIVRHPSVARADGIDARAARIVRSPPLSPRRGGRLDGAPAWMARAVRLLAYGLAFLATLMLCRAALASPLIPAHSKIGRTVGALRSDPVGWLRAAPAVMTRTWMQRGVPAASAHAAGLFRIVFGTSVLALVVAERIDPAVLQSYEANAAEGVYGMVLRWLGAHPAVAQHLGQALTVSGALFIAGFLTRISYACFVAGFLLWACIFTLTTSTHAVAALAITMLCLLVARWGDGWSVDALVRRIRRRPLPPVSAQRYGFAIWIPRLVLGTAFLAAAWSKVSGSGLDWILNGTVKYYFISDLDHALVSWGPRLTQHHWVAVVMSGSAVVVESLVITAAFSRSSAYTLLLGVAALGVLTGFALFQGVLWWGWWILLIAFLPWHRLRLPWPRRRAPVPAAVATFGFSPAQVLVVVMLIVQQVVMSAFHLEARPMLSAYDMYSATYASAGEFEDATNLVYRVAVFDNGRYRDLPDCLVDDRAAALVMTAASGGVDARAYLRSLLGPCLEAEPAASAFALEGDRRVYNWDERRFEWKRAIDVIGPVSAEWLRN